MYTGQMEAYIDFELTKKLEAFVVNALPQRSKQSDFNIIYLANLEVGEEDGILRQSAIETDDSIFMTFVNEFGNIDYEFIKMAHVVGVLESDFELISYIPDFSDIKKFANYYEGHEVPVGGDYLQIAFCPFGINVIELLNGDEIEIFGTGRHKITREQRGFKSYVEIPKVNKILSNDFYKILKLAIYTRYSQYSGNTISMNVFSPSMRTIEEEIQGRIPISDDRLISYITGGLERTENGVTYVRDKKTDQLHRADVNYGSTSALAGLGPMISVSKSGFIDLSSIGTSIRDGFSVHINFSITEFANRGTVIAEMGYGYTDDGFNTHTISLYTNPDGEIIYNMRFVDEWINTGFVLRDSFEHTITLTSENQKYDELDEDEFVTFIHVDGQQIWPKQEMLKPTEKVYLWRALQAYEVYTNVCTKLPSPHPVSGGEDPKGVCVKKLLHESGFMTIEALQNVYQLYLNRPRANAADLNDIIIATTDHSEIEGVIFGQDVKRDIIDEEYYMIGEYSEIAIFSPPLSVIEIQDIHLLNTTKIPSIEL